MSSLERIAFFLLLALIAMLPFEFQLLPLLSNLQWLFVALTVAALPLILQNRKNLLRDRLVLAGLVFVGTQWLAAMMADEFTANALKGAVRVTAGLVLMCAVMCIGSGARLRLIMRVWTVAAIAAALYGFLDFMGFGIPHLFRDQEFLFGNARRLSGSFEYPNTAAAFFAQSLPLVWASPKVQWLRVPASLLIWIALLLTYSRGATIAVLVMLLVWAAAGRSKALVPLGIMCVAVLAILLVLKPSLLKRFIGREVPQTLAAEYDVKFNLLQLAPNQTWKLVISAKNTGTETWQTDGEHVVTMAYRWFDLATSKRVVPKTILTPLPRPIGPQESVTIETAFNTPDRPGKYLLIFELNQLNFGWFGLQGAPPIIMEADIRERGEPSFGLGDMSRWYRPENSEFLAAKLLTTRLDLWKAARDIWLEHPVFGAGPDNFRLLYGKQLELAQPDTNIRANSLYLELLSGSGLAGLAAFAFMMTAVRWQAGPAAIALGVFLMHGLVDDFMMTTPIYFAFWILLGLTSVKNESGFLWDWRIVL